MKILLEHFCFFGSEENRNSWRETGWTRLWRNRVLLENVEWGCSSRTSRNFPCILFYDAAYHRRVNFHWRKLRSKKKHRFEVWSTAGCWVWDKTYAVKVCCYWTFRSPDYVTRTQLSPKFKELVFIMQIIWRPNGHLEEQLYQYFMRPTKPLVKLSIEVKYCTVVWSLDWALRMLPKL